MDDDEKVLEWDSEEKILYLDQTGVNVKDLETLLDAMDNAMCVFLLFFMYSSITKPPQYIRVQDAFIPGYGLHPPGILSPFFQ